MKSTNIQIKIQWDEHCSRHESGNGINKENPKLMKKLERKNLGIQTDILEVSYQESTRHETMKTR